MPLILAHPDKTEPLIDSTMEIGLVNNLSDAGFERGERQISELMAAVAGDGIVRLSLFTLPSIKRGASAGDRIRARYLPFSQLKFSRLDGLIVTGCEPQADALPKEIFWRELTEVIDWAEHNTRSTIWSCLAAHAAVLHLDGIERRRLTTKKSGLFRVDTAAPHPLLVGAPRDLHVPHSRWNELDPAQLVAAGYKILTRSGVAGADTFIKPWRSLFVYLQGHPEYDDGALGREYRRDVLRYLCGACQTYPSLPKNYFDAPTEAALAKFALQARTQRGPGFAEALPTCLGVRATGPRNLGRPLLRNWLRYVSNPTTGPQLLQPEDTTNASV